MKPPDVSRKPVIIGAMKSILPALYAKLPYDTLGDLAPIAGHVHVMFNNVQTTMPHVANGKLVALAIGPEAFQQFLKQELTKWSKVIESAGIKVE
jgi:hypothetical protein